MNFHEGQLNSEYLNNFQILEIATCRSEHFYMYDI